MDYIGKKMNESIPIISVVMFCLISALAGFQGGCAFSSQKNLGILAQHQSCSIDAPCLEKINALREFIENIDIPDDSKRQILKSVQNEYDYIERKTMLQLGRETYKISREKKVD